MTQSPDVQFPIVVTTGQGKKPAKRRTKSNLPLIFLGVLALALAICGIAVGLGYWALFPERIDATTGKSYLDSAKKALSWGPNSKKEPKNGPSSPAGRDFVLLTMLLHASNEDSPKQERPAPTREDSNLGKENLRHAFAQFAKAKTFNEEPTTILDGAYARGALKFHGMTHAQFRAEYDKYYASIPDTEPKNEKNKKGRK